MTDVLLNADEMSREEVLALLGNSEENMSRALILGLPKPLRQIMWKRRLGDGRVHSVWVPVWHREKVLEWHDRAIAMVQDFVPLTRLVH